jgi:hypothetical protein
MCKKQHWLFFNYMIIHLFIYLHIFAREWIIPSTFNYLWIKKQLFYLKMQGGGICMFPAYIDISSCF